MKKIFEIEAAFYKTLIWLTVSLIVLVPIFIAAYLLKPWIDKAPAWKIAVLMSCLFFTFKFYVRIVQSEVDNIFQRRKYDLNKAINKLVEKMIHLKGLDKLVRKIEETLAGTLYPQKITIFIHSGAENSFQLVDAIPLSSVVELSGEDKFLKKLFKADKIVLKKFTDTDPEYAEIKEAAREYFDSQEVVLAIPLVLNDRPLGIINLGRKINMRRYNSFDMEFLVRLKNEITIAMSNSLLYDRVEESVKKRTKELLDMQKQLIQAEKLATVGTLAGGVAHEINNPLAAILTNAQMLLMTTENSQDKESVQLIEEAAKRCRNIVQNLMVYSRKPLSGREINEVRIKNVLNNVMAFLGYQLSQENIKVNINAGTRPLIVKGCQNELEQVFTNLILNAKDAVKKIKKSGEINIFASEINGKIVIEVRDDGAGIARQNITKIFDPFFTTKDVGKGTGLGLSICQSITEQHGGTISCESIEGEGANFIITFPELQIDINRIERVLSIK